jgi:hypothetical protein
MAMKFSTSYEQQMMKAGFYLRMLKPKQWMHTHSPNKSKTFKQRSAVTKLMPTVSWARKGVLVVEFIQGTTITSQAYCETLKKLRRAIQKKAWNAEHLL